jgi:uncharacterized membrane protein YfcA
MNTQEIITLIIIGVLSGCLSGFLGLGGGIIIIPMLVYLMGFSQQAAQGTTLGVLALPVGLLAAFQYYKAGMVNIKAVIIIAVIFIPASYIASKFATDVYSGILRKMFALILMVIAVKMFTAK